MAQNHKGPPDASKSEGAFRWHLLKNIESVASGWSPLAVAKIHRLLQKKRMFRVDEREKESIALRVGMLLASYSISLYEQFPKLIVC